MIEKVHTFCISYIFIILFYTSNLSYLCILYPWCWPHRQLKHVAVHCMYKLISVRVSALVDGVYSINAWLMGHFNWLVCRFLVHLAMDCLSHLAFPHLTSDVEIHCELAYKADSVTQSQSDNDFGNDVEWYNNICTYYVCLVFLTKDFNLSALGSYTCQLKLPTNIHDHKDFFWVLFVILSWDESHSLKKYFTFGCLWINRNVVHFTELTGHVGLNHICLYTMGTVQTDQNQNDGNIH